MYRYIIEVLGCKVSYYDSRKIAEILRKLGFLEINPKIAEEQVLDVNLYILHSCSVTSRASQKVRQYLSSARKKYPNAKIILSGCETALINLDTDNQKVKSLFDEIIPVKFDEEDIKNVIFKLFGRNISNSICTNYNYKFFLSDFSNKEDIFAQNVYETKNCTNSTEQRTRAFVKIQDGCNQFCSYCVVPHIRGSEHSREIIDVFNEVERLVEQGYKEVVLTGIHLGRYKYNLYKLLKELDKIENLKRIRLSSIEAKEITNELIDWLKYSEKACHHLHIPLQSGSNKILQLMNRPYTVEEYLRVIDYIRSKIRSDFAFSTDIIVGFPDESDDDFNSTINIVNKVEFMRLHIFRFSPRKGTKAASMPHQIPEYLKKERYQALDKIWKENSLKYNKTWLGKTVEVLWEQSDGRHWYGFSREYISCMFDILQSNDKLHKNSISLHVVRQCDKDYLYVA